MAHTNSTSHYGYPQFIGTDKPAWLTDVNTAYDDIDGDIYTAQTKADDAYTLANTADGKADNATLTANSALTNAGTANTNIGTMANLETTEKTSLVGAINEVKGGVDDNSNKIANFNLTSFETYTDSDITNATGTLYVATNADGSLAKIYGSISCAGYPSTGDAKISTSLRPTSDITIVGGCITSPALSSGQPQAIGMSSYTIKTNGDVEVHYGWYNGNTATVNLLFVNSLIFVKDFGDEPIPTPNE